MERLTMDSVIDVSGKYKGKKVSEVVRDGSRAIIQLAKKGLSFDDEVLSAVRLKSTVRDRHAEWKLERGVKSNTVYQKDTAQMSDIIKSLSTVENEREKLESNLDEDISDQNEDDIDA